MTPQRKDWLKLDLSEGYQKLCEQDHPSPIYVFGDDLIESSKMVKATHLMHQNVSARKLYKPSSATFSRSSQNTSSRISSLNYQVQKKNYQHYPTSIWQTVIHSVKRKKARNLGQIKQSSNPARSFWKGNTFPSMLDK